MIFGKPVEKKRRDISRRINSREPRRRSAGAGTDDNSGGARRAGRAGDQDDEMR